MSASDWQAALQALPPLRDVIARHELAAKKSLGQNFLLDLNLTARIAAIAGDLTGMTIIEVGPGPGGLTRALVGSNAKSIIAIERDARCIAALTPLVVASNNRLQIIEGDAQRVDYAALGEAPRAVIANLPYNIGTDLLVGWLLQPGLFRSLTLMFQKEVAERITSQPDSKAYGRLAVLSQAAAKVRLALVLPPSAFTPPPKVHSAVVHFIPHATPLAPLDILGRITAAAFGQRRKMLRGSLSSLFSVADLEAHGIAPTLRAEDVTVAQYCALTHTLAKRLPNKGNAAKVPPC